MLALKIKWRDPVGLGTADTAGVCRCDDGAEYVLKDNKAHPMTAHSEWFCTQLAAAVKIACPPCGIIEDSPGDFLFGSRWEGGLSPDHWIDMVKRGDILVSDVSVPLSRILTFDHFVYNEDRHIKNYIVRSTKGGWLMLAMDFSRSWAVNGFPPPLPPFALTQNTRKGYREIKREIGDFLDLSEVNAVLDSLIAIKRDTIDNILNQQPNNWLTNKQKNALLAWWKSSSRPSRIEAIRKGIGDGSYL